MVVAVSISLMFVCVLLAAGGIALEREEHTLARLVRGSPTPSPSPSHRGTRCRVGGALISREPLIAEKLLLAAGCAAVVAFAMLAGIGAFVGLEWGRVGQWLVALAARRAGVRRAGGGDRRARPRGSRGLAAGLPAVAAARLPGARPRGRGSGRACTTRSARSRSCSPTRPPCRRSTRPSTGSSPGPRRLARAPVRADRAVRRAWRGSGCGGWSDWSRPAAPGQRPRREYGAAGVGDPTHPTLVRGTPTARPAGVSSTDVAFPQTRMRRLRASPALRGLVRETELRAGQLVLPLFVEERPGPAPSGSATALPGLKRLSIPEAVEAAREAARLGLGAVLLFGIPAEKDAQGSSAWDGRRRGAAVRARAQGTRCRSCS